MRVKELPHFSSDEGESVSVPDFFFTRLLPEIDDLSELKIALNIFGLLSRKPGKVRFVTWDELEQDELLIGSFASEVCSPAETLHRALEGMVGRGMLLHLAVNREDKQRELYFLNTEAGREAMGMMQTGELPPEEVISETVGKPNIFTMYEQNIGMLTPMIADELKEAEKLYPASWIEDAFREAVSLNKRSWRYIAKILERWSSEGMSFAHRPAHPQKEGRLYGKPGKYPEKRTDSDKYIRGKYGHIVRR